MPDYRVQAILHHDTNLPEDVTTNTWNFEAANVADLEDIAGALAAFYNTIDQYFSALLSGTVTLKAYDLADAMPRQPVFTDDFAITPGTTAMPPQVALVMSFQAAATSGVQQNRRRNRVYLGPFAEDANLGTNGQPKPAVTNAVQAAGEALLLTSDTEVNWTWQIWSPTNNPPVGPGLGGLPVNNGWVDNRWDTQRRRLQRPTGRATFEG